MDTGKQNTFFDKFNWLITNMILDPILILGSGLSRMEVVGAALATIISQAMVTIVFLITAARKTELFPN